MCQITAYLNDEKIMDDVMLVEPTLTGVRLSTLFEQPREIPARIKKLDLYKNKLYLEDQTGNGEENG
ncbi:MAG TPA: CooT family nickel-binding protein [Chloroflexi bacterium]|nr:MAG: hypothetical protein DRI65_00965 [Chloroflexota bacterium]HDN04618.1 CooT family nickel-binding protein [Chloroflexota bacterium]